MPQVHLSKGSRNNEMKHLFITRFVTALVLLINTSVLLAVSPETSWKFDFGSGDLADGYIRITADSRYSTDVGYGFIGDPELVMKDYDTPDKVASDYCSSAKPYYFTIDLPEEGNYLVKVVTGDLAGISDMTVKAESRRLMLEKVKSEKGKIVSREFVVNCRNDVIGDGRKVRLKKREFGVWHWDSKLTLEFNGKRACLCGLTIEKVDNIPVIFLAGDSTVTDQPREPWTSWGQMLPRFFKPDIAVANHAESGETLAGFTAERRFEKIFSQMNAGDYLFIQFAHNDMKRGNPGEISYQETLRELVKQTRSANAYPVLVTSMHRRRFDSKGKVIDTMQGFPEAMKQVAGELDVPCIDLHAMSREFYEAIGPEKSALAFQDGTHHNAYGAYELARCIVQGIREQIPSLREHLIDPDGAYTPAQPDDVDSFYIPASAMSSDLKPDGD